MNTCASIQDLLFNIQVLNHFDSVFKSKVWQDIDYDTAKTVLEECTNFNNQLIAPLNHKGDIYPSQFNAIDNTVKTTEGFVSAFKQFTQSGWQGLQHPIAYGGQGLPKLIAAGCTEILNAANLSFALCPLLTDGAIETLLIAGSDEQKNHYVPQLISGQYTGTMNLTEPQAGSDLSAICTQAIPQYDEKNKCHSYRLYGQKIFITYGEHDMADNIIHLVLARTPHAPEGVKGISLFIVPKWTTSIPTNRDNSVLQMTDVNQINHTGSNILRRNDIFCIGLEHKLGIKASPTASLLLGGNMGEVGKGAIGYLIGQENKGLDYMFIMMNNARYAVGVQSIGLAYRAYQSAVNYAKYRIQGRAIGNVSTHPIIYHPDIRRMLMAMRALTEGCRAMAMYAAAISDGMPAHQSLNIYSELKAEYEFLVPLIKTYSTEMCIEVTHLAVQVHGGLGFIEGTDVTQYYRDAKILTIYEGTSAIQANDFISRKTLRDQGKMAYSIINKIRATYTQLGFYGDKAKIIAQSLSNALNDFKAALQFILANYELYPQSVYAGSVPYTLLVGNVLAGWQLARMALFALHNLQGIDSHNIAFMQAKITTALFYAQHILPRTHAWKQAIITGADTALFVDIHSI